MSEGPANRRWFRFGLRTVFVVVTVFGCWLGWQIHVVNKRIEVLSGVNSRVKPHLDFVHSIPLTGYTVPWRSEFVQARAPMSATVPIVRKWLGDKPRSSITAASLEDAELAKAWFPESTISYCLDPAGQFPPGFGHPAAWNTEVRHGDKVLRFSTQPID